MIAAALLVNILIANLAVSFKFRCNLKSIQSTFKFPLSMSALDETIEKIILATPPNSVVVIKYGGHAMENEEFKDYFCDDIATLCKIGILPIIVHGGGPQIAETLKSLKIESKFIQGLRVTDAKTMEIAQMVLCGSINKELCGKISSRDGIRGAIGLSGLDGKLIQAKKIVKLAMNEQGVEERIDLGLVGDPDASGINVGLLKDLLSLSLVPVIAPVGYNQEDGGSLNINADTAAGAVAEALKADRLLLLTDVTGVLDKDRKLIPLIESSELSNFIADGTITGGMIPKLETAVHAVEAGAGMVAIADGRVKYSVLKALSGEPFGTKIVKG